MKTIIFILVMFCQGLAMLMIGLFIMLLAIRVILGFCKRSVEKGYSRKHAHGHF